MGRLSLGSVAAAGMLRRVLLLVPCVAVLTVGCSDTSFLGRRYDNVTAYYNTFHNARKAFDKGVRSVEETERAVGRTQYLTVFPEPRGSGDEEAFEKAVQKSADVLREHPNSKWVDDALLLIGKSYFYQQNYAGAAQKCREVVALGTERATEARFWLARALVAAGSYEEATTVLQDGLSGTAEGGSWQARLWLLRGELAARQERWTDAAQALSRGLEGEPPDEAAARGAFLLGQVQETLGSLSTARVAYQQVRAFSPPYELGVMARLNEIELQGRTNTAEALDRLDDLESDDKTLEIREDIAITRARVYRAQGRHDQARRVLRQALYQSDRSSSGTDRGRLHYDLATLYRDAYEDFSQAAAHFDTARTALGAASLSPRDERPVPTAPVDAETQANQYRNLAERARDVSRMDSLLRVGRMSEDEFEAFVAERRRRQGEEAEQARADRQDTRRLRRGGQAVAAQRREAAPAADTRTSDAGFLFYKDPSRVQEGKRRFERTWGERPRVDNWRRRAAMRYSQDNAEAPATTGDAAQPGEQQGTANAGLDLSAIPRDSASQAEMEGKLAVARYELGNALFLAAGRPDSAATWYRRILQESGDHPVAERALYALAETYWAQGDSTAARQAYRRLLRTHPDTELAARARDRLGRGPAEPSENRAALADTAYARAYARWQEGRMETGLDQLLDVARRYPNTDAAPRALLAAGVVYWRWMQQDTTEAPRATLDDHLRALRPADSAASGGVPLPAADTTAQQQGDAPERPPADTTTERGADRDEETRPPETDSTQAGRPLPRPASDSTAQGDGADSTRTDSTRTDSTRADSTRLDSTPVDTTQAERDRYTPLETLLQYLTDRYPEAPQVDRARSILDLIAERRRPSDSTRADTAGARSGPADSTRADAAADPADEGQAGPDRAPARTADRSMRSAEEDPADSADEREADPLPAPTGRDVGPLRSDGAGIDRSQGGWTLLVATFADAQVASNRKEEIEREVGTRWAVDVLEDEQGDTLQYRLVVGQFEAERQAAQVRDRLAEMLSTQLEVWSLSGPSSSP